MAWPMPSIEPPNVCPCRLRRVPHRAHVGHGGVVDDAPGAGLDVHLDLGEAGDERVRVAVALVVVLGDANQALPGDNLQRVLGEHVDVVGADVAVVGAAEFDRLLRDFREAERTDLAVGHLVAGGRAAAHLAATSCSLVLRSVAAAWAARVMACTVWLPADTQVHGRPLAELPQTTSNCSHGVSSTSA